MKLRTAFSRAAVPLFSDMTALYCTFLLLTSLSKSGIMLTFSFPGLFAAGMAAALVNCLLVLRQATLQTATLVNLILILLAEYLVLPTLSAGATLSGYIWCGALLAFPALRSLNLALHPIDDKTVLIYGELSVLGTGVYLLLQLSPFTAPTFTNALCIAALLLNLTTLSASRTGGNVSQTAALPNLQRRVILTVAVLVLLLLTGALGLILLPSGQQVIVQLLTTCRDGVLLAAGLVGRFIGFLLSLLPSPTTSSGFMPEPEPELILEGGDAPEATGGGLILLVIAAALAVAGLVCLLYRLRRLRLRAGTGESTRPQMDASPTPSLLALLCRLLAGLGRKIHFGVLLLSNWNTWAGLYLRLERRGRRRGHPRQPGQTPREYLVHLSTGTDNPQTRADLSALAQQIDLLCYSTRPVRGKPSREQIHSILSSIPKSQRKSKGSTKAQTA